MCAAPGGKAFQTICLDNEVTLNDISLKRMKLHLEQISKDLTLVMKLKIIML